MEGKEVSKEIRESKDILKELFKKRSIIKGRLTKFKDYLNRFSQMPSNELTSVQSKELSLRLDKYQELLTEFNNIQSDIEVKCINEDEQLAERDAIESQFYSLISTAQELIECANLDKKSVCNESTSSHCTHSMNSIRLPTIDLPKFDGNYLKWLEYRDTFDSLVNTNDSIPLINKFHYLRSSLESSAAVVLRSIEFTTDNYRNAWKTLCDRYDNKNILINNHLKALLSIDPIVRESFKALRYLIDHVSKNLRSLHTLGLPIDQWDVLLIFIISAKLDSITSRKWEEYRNNLEQLPTLEQFYSFLRKRADVLETTHYNRSDKHDFKPNLQNNNNKAIRSFLTASESQIKKNTCGICKQSHFVHECSRFKGMCFDDRMREVAALRLCTKCLRGGHNIYQCRLKGSCQICKGKHNTLLHGYQKGAATADASGQSASSISTDMRLASERPPSVTLSTVTMTHTLLCTAQVEIFNKCNNKSVEVRALLDSGSQSSFLTEIIRNKLGLSRNVSKNFEVCGLNNIKTNISGSCDITLKSCSTSFNTNVHCLVVPTITGVLPSIEIDIRRLGIPEGIELADPSFFQPSSIDVLLGADVFWNIIGTNQIKLGPNMPTLQDSQLGWLIAGPVGICPSNLKVNCYLNQVSNIDNILKSFWEVEELPSETKTFSLEEQFCEQHFSENTSRLPDGRFCVYLPLKEPEKNLEDSYGVAKKRFYNLERKLNKDSELKESYIKFINEYKDLGHLVEIERPKFGNYLPHHCVIKEKSETTKLRVVFDASVKTSSGKSLNDIQAVGPVIQSDLFSILLRFRGHKYVLLGDIEKMYRQIMLHPSQRHLQLILWRDESRTESDDTHLRILQLNTLTYGMASAPFLSTRCLLQLARECNVETISKIIENDFYIDDLNTGAEDEAQLQYIYKSLKTILDSAGFPLRKIRTNCSQAFSSDSNIHSSVDLTKESSVLGLNYCPRFDIIQFPSYTDISPLLTKRVVIATICKIFDPLGLICACVINAKIFLQQLWIAKLNWEDSIPQPLLSAWLKFINNLKYISDIKINRNVRCQSPIATELHCFVDASQRAYAACVYLRSINNNQEVTVRLLCAKARVAPLRPTTIPRLELLGCLLGARLCQKVLQSLRFDISKKTIWTDSTIVLGWLKTDVRNLKMFVCNRVNEINELTDDFNFKHISTHMNPADLASRGIEPQDLASSLLWWEGPSFLKLNPSEWPQHSYVVNKILPEIKAQSLLCNTHEIISIKNSLIDFKRFSNFIKLNRTFAYVLRFLNNCNKQNQRLSGFLNIEELNNSLQFLIKFSQWESFSDEIRLIKLKQTLSNKSKLLQLTPFLDSNDIIRVGGRLLNSRFNYDKKHPIILDAKHDFTKLIMIHEHVRLFHANQQLILASIRDKYWPIGGRCLARRVVRQCAICVRLRAEVVQPIMGHLPEARTNATFPFNSCGIDFGGPFFICSRKGRGNRISKCYLCLFVCLSTKAVHLELVSDLSMQAFILCLKRFVARRGKPHEIFCDNGRNFVGASNELGRVLRSSRQSVYEYASTDGIKFNFSPAYSPHFGGIFEAGIKSAKYHLKRIAGNAALTFEELATLFSQIEAILNSRPLSPLSSTCTDPSPLTPGHFLIGRPLMSIPTLPVNVARPNRYELIEKIRQHFWDRWRQEYISELQQRTKWRAPQKGLACGDVVILKEDNLPPLQWRLGRVCRLYPGIDGVCRVADVTTAKGIIRRAVNKMCLLPIAMSDEGEEKPLRPASTTATSIVVES